MKFYSTNAQKVFDQYESVSFEAVHDKWRDFMPAEGCVLDVGCGSGRDAAWFAIKGFKVIAVDPAKELLDISKEKHKHENITWLEDSLPSLGHIVFLKKQFDLILLSAVWMHLTQEERRCSLAVLKNLLKVGGKLVITLRHGTFNDERIAYPLSSDEVVELGQKFGMSTILVTQLVSDELGRESVQWQTIILGN